MQMLHKSLVLQVLLAFALTLSSCHAFNLYNISMLSGQIDVYGHSTAYPNGKFKCCMSYRGPSSSKTHVCDLMGNGDGFGVFLRCTSPQFCLCNDQPVDVWIRNKTDGSLAWINVGNGMAQRVQNAASLSTSKLPNGVADWGGFGIDFIGNGIDYSTIALTDTYLKSMIYCQIDNQNYVQGKLKVYLSYCPEKKMKLSVSSTNGCSHSSVVSLKLKHLEPPSITSMSPTTAPLWADSMNVPKLKLTFTDVGASIEELGGLSAEFTYTKTSNGVISSSSDSYPLTVTSTTSAEVKIPTNTDQTAMDDSQLAISPNSKWTVCIRPMQIMEEGDVTLWKLKSRCRTLTYGTNPPNTASISSLIPDSAPDTGSDSSLSIIGSGFSGFNNMAGRLKVKFGSVYMRPSSYNVFNDTLIVMDSIKKYPIGKNGGDIHVSVTNNGVDFSNPVNFRYHRTEFQFRDVDTTETSLSASISGSVVGGIPPYDYELRFNPKSAKVDILREAHPHCQVNCTVALPVVSYSGFPSTSTTGLLYKNQFSFNMNCPTLFGGAPFSALARDSAGNEIVTGLIGERSLKSDCVFSRSFNLSFPARVSCASLSPPFTINISQPFGQCASDDIVVNGQYGSYSRVSPGLVTTKVPPGVLTSASQSVCLGMLGTLDVGAVKSVFILGPVGNYEFRILDSSYCISSPPVRFHLDFNDESLLAVLIACMSFFLLSIAIRMYSLYREKGSWKNVSKQFYFKFRLHKSAVGTKLAWRAHNRSLVGWLIIMFIMSIIGLVLFLIPNSDVYSQLPANLGRFSVAGILTVRSSSESNAQIMMYFQVIQYSLYFLVFIVVELEWGLGRRLLEPTGERQHDLQSRSTSKSIVLRNLPCSNALEIARLIDTNINVKSKVDSVWICVHETSQITSLLRKLSRYGPHDGQISALGKNVERNVERAAKMKRIAAVVTFTDQLELDDLQLDHLNEMVSELEWNDVNTDNTSPYIAGGEIADGDGAEKNVKANAFTAILSRLRLASAFRINESVNDVECGSFAIYGPQSWLRTAINPIFLVLVIILSVILLVQLNAMTFGESIIPHALAKVNVLPRTIQGYLSFMIFFESIRFLDLNVGTALATFVEFVIVNFVLLRSLNIASEFSPSHSKSSGFRTKIIWGLASGWIVTCFVAISLGLLGFIAVVFMGCYNAVGSTMMHWIMAYVAQYIIQSSFILPSLRMLALAINSFASITKSDRFNSLRSSRTWQRFWWILSGGLVTHTHTNRKSVNDDDMDESEDQDLEVIEESSNLPISIFINESLVLFIVIILGPTNPLLFVFGFVYFLIATTFERHYLLAGAISNGLSREIGAKILRTEGWAVLLATIFSALYNLLWVPIMVNFRPSTSSVSSGSGSSGFTAEFEPVIRSTGISIAIIVIMSVVELLPRSWWSKIFCIRRMWFKLKNKYTNDLGGLEQGLIERVEDQGSDDGDDGAGAGEGNPSMRYGQRNLEKWLDVRILDRLRWSAVPGH